MTSWVCFHAWNCGPEIHTGTPSALQAHVEHAEQHVAVADEEVAARVTHRR